MRYIVFFLLCISFGCKKPGTKAADELCSCYGEKENLDNKWAFHCDSLIIKKYYSYKLHFTENTLLILWEYHPTRRDSLLKVARQKNITVQEIEDAIEFEHDFTDQFIKCPTK